MKKNFLKLFATFCCILITLNSCRNEITSTENQDGHHHLTENQKVKINHLKGNEASKIADRLISKMNSSKELKVLSREINHIEIDKGEIDYTDILQVIDLETGVENYTFRIKNHPDDDYDTFHNLVYTYDKDLEFINIVEYKLSEAFAESYNTTGSAMNFSGSLSLQPISNDLCPEIVNPGNPNPNNPSYPFPGGGIGGGPGPGTGPGTGPGPGTGGGGGGGDSCTRVEITFTCTNCWRSYDTWSSYQNSFWGCGNGTYGLEITVSFISTAICRTTTASCNPPGQIGVLLPNRGFTRFINSLPTNLQQIINNPANIDFYNGLDTYFQNNGNTQQTIDFITWALQFKQNNPDESFENFWNWFMEPSEGMDWNYDENFWEDPSLTFPAQALPSWNAFSSAYPNQTSAQLYGVVGGEVAQAQIDYPVQTQNGCALKVSRALNYSGIVIPNIPGKTLKGADNKYYFLNAKALNAWMRKTFGVAPTNPKHHHYTKAQGGINGANFPNLFKNKKGIFSMVSPTNSTWASGHADILYLNGTCKAGCHFFDGDILYIDFWELN